MNDFTKEELQYIKSYIFDQGASIRFDLHELLRNKLEYKIDNFYIFEHHNPEELKEIKND